MTQYPVVKEFAPAADRLVPGLPKLAALYSMIKSLRGKDTDSSPPGYRTLRSRILTGVGELIDAPMSASNHALSVTLATESDTLTYSPVR